MYSFGEKPTDQRAGVRPIAFILDNAGKLSDPVVLRIRPEELTRNEPSRATVHQTLGHDQTGWVDHFGKGLPTANISGHTGWRQTHSGGLDGAQSFDQLNQLVVHDFVDARQKAIDSGNNPALVKLIFVDNLDNFVWSVVPTNFVLRRSRSSPLLRKYQISLQAVSTDVDPPKIDIPFYGSRSNGLFALDLAEERLQGWKPKIKGWIQVATLPLAGVVKGFAESVVRFVDKALGIFNTAGQLISEAKNLVTGAANAAIGLASQVASVGVALFRTLNSIRNIPEFLKANLMAVAAAFEEVKCIFANSLRQRKVYEKYTGLYGASNCSSTTGGSPALPVSGRNVFTLLAPSAPSVSVSTVAITAMGDIQRADPVLAPMPIPTLASKMESISSGLVFS